MWPFSRRPKQPQYAPGSMPGDVLFGAPAPDDDQRAIVGVPWGQGWNPVARPVDVDRALSLAPVYGCARVLADTIASLPIDVYRRAGGDQIELPRPALFTQPATFGTLFDWVHRCITSLALRGNAFGLITGRDYLGFPTAIEWLNPDDVMVTDTLLQGPGSFLSPLWYVQGKPAPAEDIFHVPWFTVPWRVLGLSPLGLFAANINVGLAGGQYTLDWFSNGGVPPGTMQNTEATVTREEADIITSRVTSRIREHKPLVLGRDWTYTPIAINPREARFVECLAAESSVAMADGTLRRADEVQANDQIIGWDGERLARSRVQAVTKMPAGPTIRVRTQCGRELTTSPNHRYLASSRHRTPGGRYLGTLDSNADWCRADKIRVGDYIRIGTDWDAPSADEIDTETAWAFGALVGNGSMPTTGSMKYAGADPAVWDRLEQWLRRYGATLAPAGKDRENNWRINIGGTGRREGGLLRQELRQHGMIGSKSPAKHTPMAVMHGGQKTWAAFLSGLFDTDGCVIAASNKAPIVYWASASKRLLLEAQHLLAMMGVKASLRLHQRAGQYEICGQTSTIQDQWTLTACGTGNIVKLAGLLTLTHERKASRLAAWEAQGIKPGGAGSDTRWSRVVAVEDAGEQVTYGVTVEGTHTHVTEGFVTHNTARLTATQIATIYGVDPTMVGGEIGGSLTYASTEQLGLKQLTYTFGPWIARLEAALSSLFPRGTFVKFKPDGLLRTDSATRWNVYKTAVEIGAMTIPEIRQLEDLPELDPAQLPQPQSQAPPQQPAGQQNQPSTAPANEPPDQPTNGQQPTPVSPNGRRPVPAGGRQQLDASAEPPFAQPEIRRHYLPPDPWKHVAVNGNGWQQPH